MSDYAAQTLAHRVLEQWCLVGDEPMSGEQWELICGLAGVDPTATAEGATYLRTQMTLLERHARLATLAYERKCQAGESNFRRHHDAA